MKNKLLLLMTSIALVFVSCEDNPIVHPPSSSSGVAKATASVQTDLQGHTTEQNNIIARYQEDNKPGSIKHLYVLSAYSGQVLIYSTVKGKVTSSGKRLTPITVVDGGGQYYHDSYGFPVNIGGHDARTAEVLQDDGTYGSSVEYIYWFDSKGVYHQQYITGGMIVHISNQPIAIKSVVLNLETSKQ
jgi:hypothetical protein